jgi:hypothetical protein
MNIEFWLIGGCGTGRTGAGENRLGYLLRFLFRFLFDLAGQRAARPD